MRYTSPLTRTTQRQSVSPHTESTATLTSGGRRRKETDVPRRRRTPPEQQLPKASISAIERSLEGDRRREFDAQELVAFALTFDLPIVWFLLPPPGAEEYQLAGTERSVLHLVRLLFGRDGDLHDLRVR